MLKKRLKILFIVLGVMFAGCELLKQLDNNKKPGKKVADTQGNTRVKMTEVEIKQTTPINIPISINTNNLRKVNPNVVGMNTGFSFKNDMESIPEYVRLSRDMQARSLRFPGGTNSSWYHLDGNGYGIRRSEAIGKAPVSITSLMNWDAEEDENYVYNFIRMAKNSHPDVKITLDVNLLYGTPQEAVDLIDVVVKSGLKVHGIELGNELYFNQYRDKIPTVEQYITICKNFARVIKNKYPNLPLAVNMGNVMEWDSPEGKTTRTFIPWNTALAKENFYDAVVMHAYFGKEGGGNDCANLEKKGVPVMYDCYKNLLSPIHNKALEKMLTEVRKIFGKDVKIWFTEWNAGKPQFHLTNSLVHGTLTSEILLDIIEVNVNNNDAYEYAMFHNLSSQGAVYGSMYLNPNNMPNMNGSADVVAATPYYAFNFISKILGNNTKRASENFTYPAGMNASDFVFRTFYDDVAKQTYIYFINKSGRTLQLQANGFSPVSKSSVSGNMLYSSGGFGPISKSYPNLYEPTVLINEKVRILNVDPYSYGYFTLQ